MYECEKKGSSYMNDKIKRSFDFTVSYDKENDVIKIIVGNEDNQINIPSNLYVPFISVLLNAGMDLQKNGVVDLGIPNFSDGKEE